jgi:6-phospho-beta-glucosidase
MGEAGGDRHAEAGTTSSDEPAEEGYGGVAAAFLRAVTTDASERLILNTPNAGRMPFLADDAVVEAPSVVGVDGAAALPVGELPPAQRELLTRVKEVERLTIRASTTRSTEDAIQAIARHPVVASRPIAERIFGAYIERQPGFADLFD